MVLESCWRLVPIALLPGYTPHSQERRSPHCLVNHIRYPGMILLAFHRWLLGLCAPVPQSKLSESLSPAPTLCKKDPGWTDFFNGFSTTEENNTVLTLVYWFFLSGPFYFSTKQQRFYCCIGPVLMASLERSDQGIFLLQILEAAQWYSQLPW